MSKTDEKKEKEEEEKVVCTSPPTQLSSPVGSGANTIRRGINPVLDAPPLEKDQAIIEQEKQWAAQQIENKNFTPDTFKHANDILSKPFSELEPILDLDLFHQLLCLQFEYLANAPSQEANQEIKKSVTTNTYKFFPKNRTYKTTSPFEGQERYNAIAATLHTFINKIVTTSIQECPPQRCCLIQ
jgi:hypothetical protein